VDRDDELQEGVMGWFHRRYGSSPLHLLGHVAAFAVAGWAIGQILDGGTVINWIAWFAGAALLHDLVLLPLYSLLDRGLGLAVRRPPRRRGPAARRPPPRLPSVRNHLRAPAAISGVLLIVYFPLILGLPSTNYRNDTGHSLGGYARNWLLITATLFLVSALIYVTRAVMQRPRRAPASSSGEHRSREHPGA
jgi:hypothetical protein